MTYPQPHFVGGSGFLHLFTKYTGVRELYWEHSVDGEAWSADKKLAGIRESGHQRGGHYQTSARNGKAIGTFFNRHPNGIVDRRTDLYYVQTKDMGRTWTTVDGHQVDTPLVSVDHPARVIDYASRGLNVYLKDMTFDTDGRPVLMYVTSPGHEPGTPNDPRYFRVVRWTGERWEDSKICETDHNYDNGESLHHRRPLGRPNSIQCWSSGWPYRRRNSCLGESRPRENVESNWSAHSK